MSQGTPLTKEFFLEVMRGVDGRFDGLEKKLTDHDQQFVQIHEKLTEHDRQFVQIHEKLTEHDRQFVQIHEVLIDHTTQLKSIHKTLHEHDDLLEMIAGEVSGTQNLLNELVPARKDHETRITRLERGLTRLILKS